MTQYSLSAGATDLLLRILEAEAYKIHMHPRTLSVSTEVQELLNLGWATLGDAIWTENPRKRIRPICLATCHLETVQAHLQALN